MDPQHESSTVPTSPLVDYRQRHRDQYNQRNESQVNVTVVLNNLYNLGI